MRMIRVPLLMFFFVVSLIDFTFGYIHILAFVSECVKFLNKF